MFTCLPLFTTPIVQSVDFSLVVGLSSLSSQATKQTPHRSLIISLPNFRILLCIIILLRISIHTKIMKRLISKQVMQGCLINILVFWELEWRNKDFGFFCFSQFTTKNNICHYQFFVLLKVKAISPNCAHAGYKCPIQSDVQ